MNDRQLSRRISRRGVGSQIEEDKAMLTSRPQVAFLAAALVLLVLHGLGDTGAQCTRHGHASWDDVANGTDGER
jgi:hypothetical protein